MSLREAESVPCRHCNGVGQVTLPPEIDTVEVFYFGCWQEAGHFWRAPGKSWMSSRDMEAKLPEQLRHGRIDGGFCPGYNPKNSYKRTRPEVEGEAQLTHVGGWTVLGWWDRSVARRGACNSNLVVQGLHDFTTMLVIGERRCPTVMARQKQPILLVAEETRPV